jgi:hypothetical protein
MIRWRRTGFRVALSLTLVIAMAMLYPSVAPATSYTFYNCFSPHCYSIGAEQLAFSGLEGQWDDRQINMPASEVNQDYGHLNNEMWAINSSGGWVEEGLSQQCSAGPPPPGNTETCAARGGSDSYLQFWGDAASSTSKVAFHLIKTLSADGDNHSYEIWDSSDCANNDWAVYLDFNKVNTSTVQSHCRGTYFNVGIELYSPPGINGSEYTGGNSFHNFMQVYQDSVGSWADADLDSGTYHTEPCGIQFNCAMDPCDTFAAGSCLTWSLDSSSQWSDNKPEGSDSNSGLAASHAAGPALAGSNTHGTGSSTHGISRATAACERKHNVCNPAALKGLPFISATRPGTVLLTRAQVLKHFGLAGATVALVPTSYGRMHTADPVLAASSVVNPHRAIWAITQYFPRPVEMADANAPVGAPATVKVSAESFIIDAATGQVIDYCEGCAAVPRHRS